MAVRHEIEFEITPDGEIKLTVKGASGGECLEITKALEEELGMVVNREMTSEYYKEEVNVEDTVQIGED